MAKVRKFGIPAALLLSLIAAANAESERCVAAADGGWHCGKDVTDVDAAPLPERQSRNLPPVMLIDPARFGEGDIDNDSPPEVADAPNAEAPIVEVTDAASAKASETPTATEAPTLADRHNSASTAELSRPAAGKFVVQLAVASSPRGFDALLAKLGSNARNSQRRLLANGSWVLLVGSYNSIAQAREAIPSNVPGAFARDISTLNFK